MIVLRYAFCYGSVNGGFAEYSNVSASGFGQLLSVVIVSGSKWDYLLLL